MNRREFSKASGLIGLGLATGSSVTAREAMIAKDQSYYKEAARKLPARTFDVVVAGAGTAGVIAAIASARAVIEDALAIEEAGAQLLLLEAVPPEVAGFIAKKLSIPVMSIGAGPHCDGQLLIVSELIGQFQAFTPKFVKKYCNVAEIVTTAMKEYIEDVKSGSFPADEHCYHMLKAEAGGFDELTDEFK